MGKVTIIIESNNGEPDGNTDILYKVAQKLMFSEEELQYESKVSDAKIYIVPGDE